MTNDQWLYDMVVDDSEGRESQRDYMFLEKANDMGFDPGWGCRLLLAYGFL